MIVVHFVSVKDQGIHRKPSFKQTVIANPAFFAGRSNHDCRKGDCFDAGALSGVEVMTHRLYFVKLLCESPEYV